MMRFGKHFMLIAMSAAALLAHNSVFGRGPGSRDGRFFLVDQRTQIPVMCCTMPSNWLVSGKTTWTSDMVNPVSWYVWAMRPDQRVKIIVSSPTVIGSPGAIRQVQMLQDPRVFPQMLQDTARRDHNFTELSLTDAKFIPREVDPQLREARLRQAAERGIRLTQLISAELFVRYDGRCGSEPRVLFMSLPLLIAESQATAMSRTTLIELLMPMSFSAPPAEADAAKQTLLAMVRTVQLNQQFIRIVNQIVARRVEERIRVTNHIRNQQFEVARSASETQDRVRDMWSQYIRDVDAVQNPNTGEKMFVDNRYDHAWINSDNEVIYHNSGPQTFDPNRNEFFNRTNWRQLR